MLLLAAGAAGSLASVQAQIAWAPCKDSNDFACGHLTVPVEPGGDGTGVLTLAMRRHRAPVGEASEAVITLAGGPGQAAIPFAEQFAHLLGPIVATRDLIVFDQRGIGLSHPLSCHRFEVGDLGPSGTAIAECGAQLGPSRSDYTTAQTVADIEAIRQAGGYRKLVLYGTSYGTKVAERYAQAYPEHVGGLVLDSVVPPNGPDPLQRPTFAAIPRVLHQLCEARACAQITPEPVADVAQTVRRMGRGTLAGRWIDDDGHPHTLGLSPADLLEILLAGDLEPVLRAEFPAAVRSAARGDTAPLARVLANAAERGEGGGGEESPSESFDSPLYYATSCEEQQFPFSRAAAPAKRLAEARTQLAQLPASEFAPFAPPDVFAISDIPACAFWPYATPAQAPVSAPFPRTPTLILSGTDDLRTPVSGARELAAQIPGSHLLVVPGVGHSVLGSDLSGCSAKALQALFAGSPIKPCPSGRELLNLVGLVPLAPARLSDVRPTGGLPGRPGRTLDAVSETLADLGRQEAIRALSALASGNLGALLSLRVGGLRAGWAGIAHGKLALHGYSYVPGVTVSGAVSQTGAVLRVGGSASAHGTLRLSRHDQLVGRLGGTPARLPAPTGTAGAIVSEDAQASPTFAHGGPAARAAAGRLAGLLARVP